MPDIHADKWNMRTICEVHREIYRELKKRNSDEPQKQVGHSIKTTNIKI